MPLNVAVIEDIETTRENIIGKCKELSAQTGIQIFPKGYRNNTIFKKDDHKTKPDILIFDLNMDPGNPDDVSGWDAILEVMDLEFTPVILFSGHTDAATPEDCKGMYIMNVPKNGENYQELENAMKKAFRIKEQFLRERGRILDEFNKISLRSLKCLLPYPKDSEISENLITMMATARVFSVLKNSTPPGQTSVPPETIFLIPPLDPNGDENHILHGDIIKGKVGEREKNALYLVCTPSCDLIKTESRSRNINKVLLIRCYKTKEEFNSNNPQRAELSKTNIGNYESNGICKLVKCPTSLSESGFLLIFFKSYMTFDYEEIKTRFERIATISSPYIESYHNLFVSDLSRIGTPDIKKPEDEREWKNNFFDYTPHR
jgi:hypothetical protein